MCFGPENARLNYASGLVVVEDGEADIYHNEVASGQFICTYQSNKDACGSDSGGPSLDAEGNLFGAMSFGPSCFTSMVYFRARLEENAGVDNVDNGQISDNASPTLLGPAERPAIPTRKPRRRTCRWCPPRFEDLLERSRPWIEYHYQLERQWQR